MSFPPHKLAEFEALTMPEPNSGCHLFLGRLTPTGYGRFSLNGKNRPAHQVALDIAGRPRPLGLEAHHKCFVRCCVNEQHLEYLTHRENLLRSDTLTARAVAKTHCPQGHPLGGINLMIRGGGRNCRQCDRDRQNAKYQPKTNRQRRRHTTKAQRSLIIEMLKNGDSHEKIAATVNVSAATVSMIRNRKYRHDRPANNL